MVSMEGKLVKMQIWDTAGDEKYYGMVKMYYVGASACLLIFDPTDKVFIYFLLYFYFTFIFKRIYLFFHFILFNLRIFLFCLLI